MTTAEELISFAKQHGLYIAPYRDPVEWADTINTLGNGKCLCDESRICPCDEAIDDIQAMIDEGNAEDATCKCMFYCSKEHYEVNKKFVKNKQPSAAQTVTRPPASPQPADIEFTVEPVVDIRDIRNPDVRRVINALQNAKRYLVQQRPDDAIKCLEEELEQQGCELCKEFFNEILMRIRLAILTCTMGADVCGYDVMTLYRRIADLEKLYCDVDKEIMKDQGVVQPGRPLTGSPDAYHHCVSTLLSSDLGRRLGLSRKDLFRVVSTYCAKTAAKGQPFSVDGAAEFYRLSSEGGGGEQ